MQKDGRQGNISINLAAPSELKQLYAMQPHVDNIKLSQLTKDGDIRNCWQRNRMFADIMAIYRCWNPWNIWVL